MVAKIVQWVTSENLEDLTPLRRSLSSKEMLVDLDNVESILDPQGADAWAIYHLVKEPSQFSNICLVITLGFIAPLRFCSATTKSLTMRTLASNKPTLHAVNDVYCLGRTVRLQAAVFCRQRRLEDAKTEALRALEIF